ncbi:HNH endonuclease [Phytoactinopolyspora alkaliphila]|uniref:HNH endonuclease n=2 Tax=Phytoactinopolyspora alkaliphila TaxID=1783498 RepID=A0A6N9YN20_9ACTN|nr:HNH endonuclease [Phytoactinopolyspora alkaliphila]NED96461.1 HNH endonuclease [Phytoactinopolyspora alkaliphila]
MSRSGELTSGLPIRQVPIRKPRPRYTGPTQSTRDQVLERDGGCLRCHSIDALQVHHRIARGMGGSSDASLNRPANLVTLCEACHRHVEEHPEWAYRAGWKIRGRNVNPASVPIATFYGWVVLCDDGRIEQALAYLDASPTEDLADLTSIQDRINETLLNEAIARWFG